MISSLRNKLSSQIKKRLKTASLYTKNSIGYLENQYNQKKFKECVFIL